MNKGFKKVETTISKYNNEDNIYNKYFKNETFDDIISVSFIDCIFDNCILNKKMFNSTLTNCLFKN